MYSAQRLIAGIFFFFLRLSAWAVEPMPDSVYDCHVTTGSGAMGLVTIQANSLQQAQSNVIGKPAITPLETREQSASVVQCVERGKGEFNDDYFQSWLEQLTR